MASNIDPSRCFHFKNSYEVIYIIHALEGEIDASYSSTATAIKQLMKVLWKPLWKIRRKSPFLFQIDQAVSDRKDTETFLWA